MERPRTERLESEGFFGTRLYAAPEQQRGEPVDARSDLYAVGCILHEMLTGAVPSQARRPRTYPHVLVLPELDKFLEGLLDQNAARRPATAREAIRRVDSVLDVYRAARTVWNELGLGQSPY
jgi:serine/threonine protein kinase